MNTLELGEPFFWRVFFLQNQVLNLTIDLYVTSYFIMATEGGARHEYESKRSS